MRDGGEVVLECSGCGERLIEVWITSPDEGSEWKLRAHCPHCNDKSWPVTIRGGFNLAGLDNTELDNFDTNGDIIEIYTLANKAKS